MTQETMDDMKQITTNNGDVIRVPDDTDEQTVRSIKAAKPCRFAEFVYTGNHPQGQNSANYDELEAWFAEAGLTIIEDDLSILIWNLERDTGIRTLEHRGKVLTYHCQARRGEQSGANGQFGYTWRADFRLIRVTEV